MCKAKSSYFVEIPPCGAEPVFGLICQRSYTTCPAVFVIYFQKSHTLRRAALVIVCQSSYATCQGGFVVLWLRFSHKAPIKICYNFAKLLARCAERDFHDFVEQLHFVPRKNCHNLSEILRNVPSRICHIFWRESTQCAKQDLS